MFPSTDQNSLWQLVKLNYMILLIYLFKPVRTFSSKLSVFSLKACGIKGIPLLSHIPSLFFPSSFPFDFMHLIFENLLKNLILLWTGKFKDMNQGSRSYKLAPHVWEAIGAATAASGSTIPSVYGVHPQNIAEDKSVCTADSWSFWALYLGPVLLKNRFLNHTYYNHFICLIKLINLCLQFEISTEDIAKIHAGFIKWVSSTYERHVPPPIFI